MSMEDDFVSRLSLEDSHAEIRRLDRELKAEQERAREAEQNMIRTMWMMCRAQKTHQIVIPQAVQDEYGSGRPLLNREDSAIRAAAVFTARLLP